MFTIHSSELRAMVSRSQRLCRLCEFPVADGGVPLEALDADKWDVWCRRELGEELQISSYAEQVSIICKYCIWEARMAHESSLDEWGEYENGCDWWKGHDNDHFFREYFYKKPVIQPCRVMLKKISSDFDHLAFENIGYPHLEVKTLTCQTSTQVKKQSDLKSADAKNIKILSCSFCKNIFLKKRYLHAHIKSLHKNAVRCKSTFCSTYFLTEDERLKHEQKFHLNSAINKMVKCIYCGLLTTSLTLKYHIKTQHKEAIKCDYKKRCPNYFHTESEKKEHIYNEHAQGLQLKITPMKCVYCDKIFNNKYQLRTHVNKFHKDVGIKCRVRGCVIFFQSQKETEEHFLQKHQHAESLKKRQCPKCSYKCNTKHNLRIHFQNVHSNKASMKSIFKCPQCPKSFHAKMSVKRHLNCVHAEHHTCQYCGKTMLKSSMKIHFLSGTCKPTPI